MRESNLLNQCLNDHTFQDWLVEKRLMQRCPPLISRDEILLTNQSLSKSEKILRNTFLIEYGYLISHFRLTNGLYKGSASWQDQRNAREILRCLRNKLSNPDELYNKPGVGWAAGIKNFELTKGPLLTLYLIEKYNSRGQNISELSMEIFGRRDRLAKHSARSFLYNLRNKLNQISDVRIVIPKDSKDNKIYKLLEYKQL
jgi:hypothetical protein